MGDGGLQRGMGGGGDWQHWRPGWATAACSVGWAAAVGSAGWAAVAGSTG
jgi:hypothetical protein